MRSIPFLICMVAISFCTQVHATSLRCEGDLVLVPDSRATVLRKCGEPFFIESSCRPTNQDVQYMIVGPNMPMVPIVPCVLVEDWYYNPGPGQFITILRFVAGSLSATRYGERVR